MDQRRSDAHLPREQSRRSIARDRAEWTVGRNRGDQINSLLALTDLNAECSGTAVTTASYSRREE